jgi:preprotein translocase subunit SecE
MSKLSEYLKGAKEELSKVVWPSRQTTINHTLVVIAISLIVAVFLGAIDYGLSKVLGLVLIK